MACPLLAEGPSVVNEISFHVGTSALKFRWNNCSTEAHNIRLMHYGLHVTI